MGGSPRHAALARQDALAVPRGAVRRRRIGRAQGRQSQLRAGRHRRHQRRPVRSHARRAARTQRGDPRLEQWREARRIPARRRQAPVRADQLRQAFHALPASRHDPARARRAFELEQRGLLAGARGGPWAWRTVRHPAGTQPPDGRTGRRSRSRPRGRRIQALTTNPSSTSGPARSRAARFWRAGFVGTARWCRR